MEFTGERVIPGQVNADLWAEHFSRYAFASRISAGADVLDIGCGTGYGTAYLARNARTAVGIDLAPDAVHFCRTNYTNTNLRFEEASASALPFPDESFDLIVAFEVLEHLSDWPQMLTEAKRVLRPTGTFLISTPNKDYYNQSRGTAGPNPFHAHEFTYDEFTAALKRNFPNVNILLQNATNGVAFTDAISQTGDAQIDDIDHNPEHASFYLGVCGITPYDVKPFVFLPRAVNVLREREQHITSLQTELAESHTQYESLQTAHTTLEEHLTQQNEWAKTLDSELSKARVRITELQQHLEQQNQWALGLDHELKQTRDVLAKLQDDFDERSRWALSLDQELAQTRAQLGAARNQIGLVTASRWYRLGRKLDLGPNLHPSE